MFSLRSLNKTKCNRKNNSIYETTPKKLIYLGNIPGAKVVMGSANRLLQRSKALILNS